MLRPRLLLVFVALAFGLWYVVAALWALVLRRMAQSVSSWEELEDAPPTGTTAVLIETRRAATTR
jgi:hypothetical protein